MGKPSSATPYESYRETQIKTATPGKLIVMLYNGAIKFLHIAKDAIKSNDIEAAHNNIIKAQDIVMELLLSLNMDAGEIAKKLSGLYLYINKKLTEANIYKKLEPIDEVLGMMEELRDVWEEVANKSSNSDSRVLEKNRVINITS